MAYEFFASYTLEDDSAYLRRFVQDVSDIVSDRRGRLRSDEIRFFSQNSIELGEDWAETVPRRSSCLTRGPRSSSLSIIRHAVIREAFR